MDFKSQINRAVSQLKKRYHPQKIILFGSMSKGKTTPDSDIDLFIVKDTRKKFLDRVSEVLNIVDYRIPIEPIIYTPSEVKKRLAMGDFFIKEITTKGKVLYEK